MKHQRDASGRAAGAEIGRPSTPSDSDFVLRTSSLVYVAYPSSLTLRSANAVQTFSTLRELRALEPGVEVLIPRWGRRESVFAEVGARHLLRLPFNAFSHLWPTTGWSYLERSWFAIRAALWLAKRRGDESERIVYVRDAVCAAWFGAGLARLVGARLIYECHALEGSNRSRGPLVQALARLIDARAIRGAARVVTLTGAFREWLAQAGLKGAAQTVVIPDAYDEARFQPRDRAAARAALGLPAGAFVVTYSGLTWADRGLDRLVRAFAALRRDAPDSLLVLAGGRESERAALAALARDLGAADAVRLPGQLPQDATVDYLAAADALVLPGAINGLNASPLKLFEYAAMARPIVAPDVPAIREVLGADGARYFADGDEADLRAALDTVRRDPDAAATAERARTRIQPFTYRGRAAAILALVREVGDGPPGPPILGGEERARLRDSPWPADAEGAADRRDEEQG